MTECGTTTYTNPDDYRVNVPGMAIDLALTGHDAFKARVTWMRMRHITVVMIEEIAPRVAFLSWALALTVFAFPLHGEPVWNGLRLRRGDFVLLGSGGHLHQLVDAGTRWGMILIPSKDFAAYSRALLGKSLPPIREMQFIRPAGKATGNLLRLHRRACRLAASHQEMMAHHEVARSAEQELIHALVNALSTAEPRDASNTQQRRAGIMVRFEKALTDGRARLSLPALSAALGVPQRTLRICCEEFVGCSPLAYARLRRLNRARSALCRADHETESVASIAKAYGFLQPGRFAVAYRELFGEMPSATFQRNSAESA